MSLREEGVDCVGCHLLVRLLLFYGNIFKSFVEGFMNGSFVTIDSKCLNQTIVHGQIFDVISFSVYVYVYRLRHRFAYVSKI